MALYFSSFKTVPNTFTPPTGFVYAPMRYRDNSNASPNLDGARESWGVTPDMISGQRAGDLTGFRSGPSQFFFSDFFLLLKPTLEEVDTPFGKGNKCVGLQIVDSDSIRLSLDNSPKGQYILSPAELGEDPATIHTALRKLSSMPEVLMILFTQKSFTSCQIRNYGEQTSKKDDPEFEGIGNGIWLMCLLIADLYDAKINSVSEWRQAGLDHINYIAEKCEFQDKDRHIINFLGRHQGEFLEHGMAQTVASNINDFPKPLLKLAQEALACETANVIPIVAKSAAKAPLGR